ncbi:cytochrome c oxidase subunit 3 [Cohaesibacter sp. ES.047]|uniref:cytochrome c oxidase subunit 3 n=1 Tax=Cohaesibacter sp. ES.047 TaxID=1798205 RepID=UPI000BB86D81|nr:cytochrome c oxidase subunit 3 [Cohaesibacter sp. ES.047]SNY92039.1 cytochrome c oxidase subunit 3 [Cohaesibacter sp. ES.047]
MAEAHTKNHDYHIIDPSPWPFIGSVSAFVMAVGAVTYFHDGPIWFMLIGLLGVLYTMIAWWRDVIKESRAGDHTPVVQMHLRYGMILFIASEVMFFVAWFWAFFDASLFAGEIQQYARAEFTGGTWPPQGIEVIDPWHLPLFNTLLLLASGTTVTWAHHALIEEDNDSLKWGLILTVLLGVIFTCVQVYEYVYAPFGFKESIYGATFFMATGFHGFHVFVGTVFLIVCLVRAYKGHFTPKKHFGFEAAAWYWHFVDVVWLFLFASIYLWGNAGGVIAHH